MRKPQREPFAEFAKLGEGIPTLRYRQNPKTASVSWGDGSLWHYHEFSAALDKERMEQELMNVWERYKAQIGRRTEMCPGSVHGCLIYAPIAMAEEVREIVRGHFTRALEIVAARIQSGTTHRDFLKSQMREEAGL